MSFPPPTRSPPPARLSTSTKYTKFQLENSPPPSYKFSLEFSTYIYKCTYNIIRNKTWVFAKANSITKTTRIFAGKNQVCFTFFFFQSFFAFSTALPRLLVIFFIRYSVFSQKHHTHRLRRRRRLDASDESHWQRGAPTHKCLQN